MKKTVPLVLLFLFSSAVFAQTSSIERIRILYQKSATDEEACKKLIGLLKYSGDIDDPLLLGYKGSATMIMAKHVFNPYKKLSYFRKGSDILQKAIKKNKQNVELRFLRFTIQSNTPSFLGYNDYIQADKQFLVQSIPELNDVVLKKYLISSLESIDTRQALKNELSK